MDTLDATDPDHRPGGVTVLWFKVEAAIYAHRKTRKLPREQTTAPTRTAAMGVWLLSAAWVAQHETDGFIPAEEVERFDPTLELSKHLVSAGYFEETSQDAENGYCLHDWLDVQRSSEELAEFRDQEAERKRRWRDRQRKGTPGQPPDGGGPDSRTTTDDPAAVLPSVPAGQTEGPTSGQTNGRTPSVTAGVRGASSTLEQSRVREELEITTTAIADAIAPSTAAPSRPRPKINPPGFDAFWDACPRKVGKGAARTAYAKALKRDGVEPDDLAAAMTRMARFWKITQTEDRFIPHPATWLNQERYADPAPDDRQTLTGTGLAVVGGEPLNGGLGQGTAAERANAFLSLRGKGPQ